MTPTAASPRNREQLGRLRHGEDLSRRPPEDGSLTQGTGVGQGDFGGHRFQLLNTPAPHPRRAR